MNTKELIEEKVKELCMMDRDPTMEDAKKAMQDIAKSAREEGGIQAIQMIAKGEGWEESEVHYLDKWKSLNKES